jgi:hypothetical protein
MPWTHYDAAGKRVPEKAAVFNCNEVTLNGPATRGFGTVVRTEYHVHSVDEPEQRKTFKSFAKINQVIELIPGHLLHCRPPSHAPQSPLSAKSLSIVQL